MTPPASQTQLLARFRLPLALLVFTVAYGTLGYRFLERWSWLDSAYMTMISLTTVGYREVQPLDANRFKDAVAKYKDAVSKAEGA